MQHKEKSKLQRLLKYMEFSSIITLVRCLSGNLLLLFIFFLPILTTNTLHAQTIIDDYVKIGSFISDSINKKEIFNRVKYLNPISQDTSIEIIRKGSTGYKLSVFSGMQWNIHEARFNRLPGIASCCPMYKEGFGSGFQAGGQLDVKLFDFLYLSLRFGYYVLDGKLTYLESRNSLVRVGDEIQPGSFKHHLIASLSDIAVAPMLGFTPYEGLTIYGGIQLGKLAKKSFHQYETLEEPRDYGVFVDTETRRRNDTAGTIPQAISSTYGLNFGISWELPLNKERTLALVPELFYYDGRTDYVKGLTWKSDAIRASLGIKYIPKEKAYYQEIRENHYIDTIVVSSDSIFSEGIKTGIPIQAKLDYSIEQNRIIDIKSLRIDTLFRRNLPKAAMELNTPAINIKTQFSTEVFPILPYIFFEKSSDSIINFFEIVVDTSKFDINNIKTDPIEFHKHILCIIGKRLRKFPEARISLIGTADTTTEKNVCHTAHKRALRVKTYFTSVWGIDSNRIIIDRGRKDCYPDNPTISKNDSAYLENQRVLISSEHDSILKPILRTRFIEPLDITPGEIIANTDGCTEIGVVHTQLQGFQNGRLLFHKEVQGIYDEIKHLIDTETALEIVGGEPLTVILTITDTLGRRATAEKKINIAKDTSTIEIERLSLILFKVSEDEIPKKAENDIVEFLKNLAPESTIKIKGFSDILGSRSVNERLSNNRAENTSKIIMNLYPMANIIEVKGYAGDEFPAGIKSYATPTERFLSRSVQIEIYKNR